MNNNIINFNDWKNKTNIFSSITKNGFEVDKKKLFELKSPSTFYLIEPLYKKVCYTAIFDRNLLVNLLKADGACEFGPQEKVYEFASKALIDIINSKDSIDNEYLEACLLAHIINFSFSKTAAVAIDKNSEFHHFGALCYYNPLRISQGVIGTIRPIAISYPTPLIDRNDLIHTLAQYMTADHNNHPDYFCGIEIHKAILNLNEFII